MSALRKTEVELDILGRQASAHIRSAEKHADQANNHLKSAAMCLYEVQQSGVVGKAFEAFLGTYGIARSTGYQLVQEYAKPEKREQRKARINAADTARRERDREIRRATDSPKTNDLPKGGLPALDAFPKRLAAALVKVRHHMTREQQARVVEFIESL